MNPALIELRQLSQSFKHACRDDFWVLRKVNASLYPGEIVSLLGKSGSGKSTLLRLIAGLLTPTKGEIYYRGQPVQGPVPGMSMVFQSFALLPWLTVLQNVELGLEAQGVDRKTRRLRALKAIDIIGMDGFESAYPKELSGGMCQRVGLARALVVNPNYLLMDEAFSALDVLTADHLQDDILSLWHQRQTHLQGILCVTHNISQAVYFSDRILIIDSQPGTITADLRIDLPHPRDESSAAFRQYVERIYILMTGRSSSRLDADLEMTHQLPDANISEWIGLLETIADHPKARFDLPDLADELSLDVDDLFPITEALQLFHFATISGGDIMITQAGRDFCAADMQQRKQMFSRQLLDSIPLAHYIRSRLDGAPGHRLSKDIFLEMLMSKLSEKEAERVLRVVIDWSRYAEIFAYDDNAGMLNLENPN